MFLGLALVRADHDAGRLVVSYASAITPQTWQGWPVATNLRANICEQAAKNSGGCK